jgi:uncharacterized protein YqeY
MPEPRLKQTLRTDLTAALKARQQVDVDAIRMAIAAISTAEVAGKRARELTDDEVIAVLVREVKKRDEAAEAFRAGGREESALEEEAQADVLRRYLPQPLTEQEMQALVAAAVEQATAEGLSGGRAMGRVMGLLKEPTAGRADGAAVAAAVKARLGMGK